MILLVVLLVVVLSAWLTHRVSQARSVLYILDHPNQRSLHVRPIPRSGGVALAVAIAVGGAAAGLGEAVMGAAPGLLPGLGLVAAVSFIEDRWGVPAIIRLAVHFAAALLLVRGGLTLATLSIPGIDIEWPLWLATAATVLYVTWMVNLYNFMDGIDGIAGGMAVIGFGTFAILGYRAGDPVFMTSSLIVASAAAGFLVFNFPPARCFMGDTGSSVLGYLVAGFTLWGSFQYIIPIWISILVFSPFVVDATATLLRRVWRGERFWQAHDTHYYQRVVRLGWTHRRTVLWAYVLMSLCAAAAVLALRSPVPGRWALLFAAACAYGVLILAVRHAER